MKLSIITINYNNKAGLQKTIDSVVCQTWKDYEWIIIDGGSTDGGRELIEKYQQHFAFWCSEPDRGVYHAMNKGVVKSKGEYLLFLNSGDVLYNEHVLKKISLILSDTDIILGNVIRADNHIFNIKYDKNLFYQLYTTSFNHQGAFIRRALLNKNPYDENFRIVSDWKFLFQTLIQENVTVEFSEEIVAIQDMTGISSDRSNKENVALNRYEREMVLNELFSPFLRKVFNDYVRYYKSPYNKYGEFLKKNSNTLYVIGRRFLKALVYIYKFSHPTCRRESL